MLFIDTDELLFIYNVVIYVCYRVIGWLCGAVVERPSLTGELSLPVLHLPYS